MITTNDYVLYSIYYHLKMFYFNYGHRFGHKNDLYQYNDHLMSTNVIWEFFVFAILYFTSKKTSDWKILGRSVWIYVNAFICVKSKLLKVSWQI